jgi:hypothetical protein
VATATGAAALRAAGLGLRLLLGICAQPASRFSALLAALGPSAGRVSKPYGQHIYAQQQQRGYRVYISIINRVVLPGLGILVQFILLRIYQIYREGQI